MQLPDYNPELPTYRDDLQMIFFSGITIVFVESLKVAGLVAMLGDDISALVIFGFTNAFTETLTRNNLVMEILYRHVLHKPTPPLTRLKGIFQGLKLRVLCTVLSNTHPHIYIQVLTFGTTTPH